jgi:hypothetical protein
MYTRGKSFKLSMHDTRDPHDSSKRASEDRLKFEPVVGSEVTKEDLSHHSGISSFKKTAIISLTLQPLWTTMGIQVRTIKQPPQ